MIDSPPKPMWIFTKHLNAVMQEFSEVLRSTWNLGLIFQVVCAACVTFRWESVFKWGEALPLGGVLTPSRPNVHPEEIIQGQPGQPSKAVGLCMPAAARCRTVLGLSNIFLSWLTLLILELVGARFGMDLPFCAQTLFSSIPGWDHNHPTNCWVQNEDCVR